MRGAGEQASLSGRAAISAEKHRREGRAQRHALVKPFSVFSSRSFIRLALRHRHSPIPRPWGMSNEKRRAIISPLHWQAQPQKAVLSN